MVTEIFLLFITLPAFGIVFVAAYIAGRFVAWLVDFVGDRL